MAFLSFLYKYGIWISVPVFILSVLLLARCISGVIKAEKETRLVSLPLLDRQEIDFALEGSVVLCMEGPMLSRRFANLEYELTGPDGGWCGAGLSCSDHRHPVFRKRSWS